MNFDGWLPVRVFWKEARPALEWCRLGDLRFTESFFESTLHLAMTHPFHHAFRLETPIEALAEWTGASPGIQPSGFVFHSSRCGSTLISRMLMAVERHVVLSEPPPVDSILSAHFRHPEVSCEQRVEWLRGMVSALGQKRAGPEDRLFVKFDAWHIADFAIVRQAFPRTPWIFLYRDPLEVLVSQFANRAPWTLPGRLHPAIAGMTEPEVEQMPINQYSARVLGRILQFGLFHHGDGGLLVNYRQLPEFVCSSLGKHFGILWTDEELDQMRAAASQDAKNPWVAFNGDTRRKRESATDEGRELVRRWMEQPYEALERARLGGAELQRS